MLALAGCDSASNGTQQSLSSNYSDENIVKQGIWSVTYNDNIISNNSLAVVYEDYGRIYIDICGSGPDSLVKPNLEPAGHGISSAKVISPTKIEINQATSSSASMKYLRPGKIHEMTLVPEYNSGSGDLTLGGVEFKSKNICGVYNTGENEDVYVEVFMRGGVNDIGSAKLGMNISYFEGPGRYVTNCSECGEENQFSWYVTSAHRDDRSPIDLNNDLSKTVLTLEKVSSNRIKGAISGNTINGRFDIFLKNKL